jgi:di/tricarboxylate transporter
MGVVSVLPLIAFFGFGVLNKDDFNGFLWNVVMLAQGGLALGEWCIGVRECQGG